MSMVFIRMKQWKGIISLLLCGINIVIKILNQHNFKSNFQIFLKTRRVSVRKWANQSEEWIKTRVFVEILLRVMQHYIPQPASSGYEKWEKLSLYSRAAPYEWYSA